MTIKTILLNDVRIDGNTQSRVSINQEVVTHYAELLGDGTNLPPIIVFFDGVDYWLADGFHRFHATTALGKKANIIADVRKGTQRDAVLFSLNANVPHGLSLTSDDKRKAVMIMLADPEWCELKDRAIARHCGCSHMTVGRLRNPERYEKEQALVTSSKKSAVEAPASDSGMPEDIGTSANPDAPQATQPAAEIEPAAPTEKEKKQQEADQNAADAHGDSDPIAMLEEAQAQIDSLQKELFALQADDQKAETLKFKRLADVATRRQNELMDTVNMREKELQRMANWLRRIGTALGEDDNAKLPALVEAMARSAKA